MQITARLALFAAVLVLAGLAGWGVGQVVGPVSFLLTPDPVSSPDTSFTHPHFPAPEGSP